MYNVWYEETEGEREQVVFNIDTKLQSKLLI